ncbi:MAG: Crp/Fnr family transcriptional regulator [Imperialibacter sp.]|uniref:Crp/Fnr family transcriptional regulator n=1 Tax=Imperialibacter sp. TaxID=2038411 RepID=UPI0032EC00B5
MPTPRTSHYLMQIASLIAYFNSFLPLTEEEVAELGQVVNRRTIKRRQFILSPGDVCKHYHFIVEGCFKMYKVDEAAREHNLHFAVENQWITDIGSFHAGSPSQLYIEAIEPSVVLQIAKPDLIQFYEKSLKFNRIFRVMVEDEFVLLQNRLLQTISTPAEQRYLEFIKLYPHLFNRISNVQIASYLGITPEFLSNIRKKLSQS